VLAFSAVATVDGAQLGLLTEHHPGKTHEERIVEKRTTYSG
jgi:hypothetical protein